MSVFDKDSKVTLHYFNFKGRGEPIRYLLRYANVEFEEHTFSREEWPPIKPTMPLGQIPVVEFTSKDGSKKEMLCQTNTIVRTLATIYGLAGKNIQQMARSDEAMESLRDLFDSVVKAWFEQDAERKAQHWEKALTEVLPRIMGFMEKRLKEGGGKSLSGGDEFTYADLAWAQAMTDFVVLIPKVDVAKVEADFPAMAGLKKAVNETPQIKAYLASRPVSDH